MSYRYSVIRFVPDVARGEFVNIGIVCGRDGADWWSRFDLRGVRGRSALNAHLRDLHPWVEWFENRIRGVEILGQDHSGPPDSGWLNALRIRQGGSVQLSEALPVDVGSAQEGVALLFPLVVQRAAPARRALRTRQSMRVEVRDALLDDLDLQIGQTLLERPFVEVGMQTERFDLGLHPDDRAQFANVWAFNITTLDDLERDIRSWNYIVGRLRQDGAQLRRGRRSTAVRNDVTIGVIVDPPVADASNRSRDILAAANEGWQLNGVRVHTREEYLTAVENGSVLATV